MPERIQLSRMKGWRMPPNTVKVDRSTRWGNACRLDAQGIPRSPDGKELTAFRGHSLSVIAGPTRGGLSPIQAGLLQEGFRTWIAAPGQAELLSYGRRELRGKNLGCWCALVMTHVRWAGGDDRFPCHADVWLELANADIGVPNVGGKNA